MLGKSKFSVLAAVFMLAACSPVRPAQPAGAPEPVSLKVGVLNYLSFSPFFIAEEEGYFDEQGLDVELIILGTANSDILPALLQRQMDAGSSTLSAAILNTVAEGGQVRIVADKGFVDPAAACAENGWVASRRVLDSGELTDYATLRGKTLVGSGGATIFEYSFDAMLAKAGITAAEVELVEIRDNPARLDALLQGTIDLAPLGEPWIARAEAMNAGRLWIPNAEIVPQFPIGSVVFGPSLLEDNPDAGVRFMVAYLKAVRQFQNDGKSQRNLEIITKYTEVPIEELQQVCWTSFRVDGHVDESSIETFIEWAASKGYVANPPALDEVWDPRFVDAANDILNK